MTYNPKTKFQTRTPPAPDFTILTTNSALFSHTTVSADLIPPLILNRHLSLLPHKTGRIIG